MESLLAAGEGDEIDRFAWPHIKAIRGDPKYAPFRSVLPIDELGVYVEGITSAGAIHLVDRWLTTRAHLRDCLGGAGDALADCIARQTRAWPGALAVAIHVDGVARVRFYRFIITRPAGRVKRAEWAARAN